MPARLAAAKAHRLQPDNQAIAQVAALVGLGRACHDHPVAGGALPVLGTLVEQRRAHW
ncbi:MAG: hypothetical protein M3461_04365 [Pseudomonadota bacterium]|nr:hypothetical protein [Pseudomonadota bacterium]